jgi:hypothetical protein
LYNVNGIPTSYSDLIKNEYKGILLQKSNEQINFINNVKKVSKKDEEKINKILTKPIRALGIASRSIFDKLANENLKITD